MMARLATVPLIVAFIVAPLSTPARAIPVPEATVRVNVAGLGLDYARITSTGLLSITGPDGALLYHGSGAAITRLGVRRLTDASRSIAWVPDPVPPDERQSKALQLREARIVARSEGVRIVTVPFEFAIEERRGRETEPLIAARVMEPLRFAAEAGELLTLDGRTFRGTLELALDDEGDLIVVNEVDTASYLASVVGSEVPGSWMPEALAAQAIAARTYLATHRRKHVAYDLEGDIRDQQYDGVEAEVPSTVRAVSRTQGMIATFAGAPIQALYSSNAGGYTEDSESVFGYSLPYLRAVPSPTDDAALLSSWGASSLRWKTEYTAPALARQLSARGLDVGELRRIELTSVSPTGRVVSARVVGSAGERDIGKDRARYYFGLRSTLFTVSVVPDAVEYVDPSDSDRMRQLEKDDATLDRVRFTNLRDPDRPRWMREATAAVYRIPARFIFNGGGFGHGVGMSQWGAQGMALAGASFATILKHYYVGIEITRTDGA